MIPHDGKKDFMHAVQQAPSLVQQESNPAAFLRSEDCNPWKAAKKLVLYWYVELHAAKISVQVPIYRELNMEISLLMFVRTFPLGDN